MQEMTDLELLAHVLEKPIAFHRVFFDITGDIKSALFLSQLFYWSKKICYDWLYKSAEDWEEETRLTRREQDRIKKQLIDLNLIETKLKGVPATLYFKFNFSQFITLAKQYYQQFEQNVETSFDKTSKLDYIKVSSDVSGDKKSNNKQEKGSPVLTKRQNWFSPNVKTISENTTESIKKISTNVDIQKDFEPSQKDLEFLKAEGFSDERIRHNLIYYQNYERKKGKPLTGRQFRQCVIANWAKYYPARDPPKTFQQQIEEQNRKNLANYQAMKEAENYEPLLEDRSTETEDEGR